MKNWWYYHKWYVICGIIVLAAAINIIGNALGVFKKTPDCCIAYIGKTALTEDIVTLLEKRFADISGDFNGDGKAVVQIKQYVDNSQSLAAGADASYYNLASGVTLTGDIASCESYFFLMEDPVLFQQEYHILAMPDGSCPDDLDYSVDNKAFLWTDVPALADIEFNSSTPATSGEKTADNSKELLSSLYIARRCFYTKDTTRYLDKCDKLWDLLFLN